MIYLFYFLDHGGNGRFTQSISRNGGVDKFRGVTMIGQLCKVDMDGPKWSGQDC